MAEESGLMHIVRRAPLFLLEVALPALPIVAAVAWLIIVTLPYYAFGLDRLPLREVFSNTTNPAHYYENVVGTGLASLMLLIWSSFHFLLVPALFLSGVTACMFRGRAKRWFAISAICCIALYIHLEHPLWTNHDVLWATDAIYDMRSPGW